MCFYSIYYFHQRESKLFDIIESMQRMKKNGMVNFKDTSSVQFFYVYTENVFFLSFNLLTLKMQYLYYTMTNIHRTWSKDYICWRETKISFIILWSFLETCGHTRTGYYFYWSDEHCFCTRLPVVHNTFAVFFKMLAYHISNGFLHWFQIMWV